MIEPTANTAPTTASRRARPYRSPSLPTSGVQTALESRCAVSSQDEVAGPIPSACDSCGSAGRMSVCDSEYVIPATSSIARTRTRVRGALAIAVGILRRQAYLKRTAAVHLGGGGYGCRMDAVRPLRADAERNRQLIIEAAVEVIGRRGLDASVDEIARAAGVGRGTLYRRFPTKDELVRSIVLDRTERAIASMEAAAAAPDPWEALAGVVRALGGHLAADRGLFDTLTRGGRPNDVVPQRPEWFQAIVDPVVTRAREAGVVRDDVAATDLIALAAAISRVRPERAGEPLWERYLELVLDGCRPEGAKAPLPHRPSRRPPSIR